MHNTISRFGRPRPQMCRCPSRANAAYVTCSSHSSGGKAAAKRSAPKSSSTPSATTAIAAAAATVTAVTVDETAAAHTSNITLVNPPLGFSNNIVPAGPLVVTPPQPDGAALVDSSDEELDDSSASSSGAAATPAGGSTGRTSAWRCLVLDSRYLPVNVIPWGRAVVMDLSGKVDVLEYHPGGFAYSAYKEHPLPAVLRVRTFVDVHEFAGRLSLTRKNIMLRDHHRCQYCGCSKELTLDHIIPVCRGGMNSWQNLVTACMPCNQRKGDKSLQQLGWKLPQPPREPTPQEVGIVAGISKADLEHPPLPWVPYLAAFKTALEKAQRRARTGGSKATRAGSSSRAVDAAFLSEQQQLVGKEASAAAGVQPAKKAAAGKPVKAAAAPKRMRH